MRAALLVIALTLAAGDARAAAQPWISPYVSDRLAAHVDQVADGRTEEALEGFARLARRVRSGSADHVLVIRQWAAILFELERFAEARAILEEALVGLDDTIAAPLLVALAQLHAIEEDFATADVYLTRWLAADSAPSPQALFLTGYVRFLLERYDEAEALVARAIEGTDRVPTAWIDVRTFALLRTGRRAEAEALIARQLTEHPEQTRWWRHFARLALDAEAYDEAAVRMAVMAAASDLDGPSVRRLAGLFATVGLPERGARLLEGALEVEPGAARLDDWMTLARLWTAARDFEAARRALQRAATADDSAEPLVLLGRLYLHRERYAEALASFDAATALTGAAPSAETAWYVAVAAWNLGELARARDALELAREHPGFTARAERLLRQLDDA